MILTWWAWGCQLVPFRKSWLGADVYSFCHLFLSIKKAFAVNLGFQETSVHWGPAWNCGLMPPLWPLSRKGKCYFLSQFLSSNSWKEGKRWNCKPISTCWFRIIKAGRRQGPRTWLRFSSFRTGIPCGLSCPIYLFSERTGLVPWVPVSLIHFIRKRQALCVGAMLPQCILTR